MCSVTLLTGQGSVCPLRNPPPSPKAMGCDGLEHVCWGDYIDADVVNAKHCREKWELLTTHGMDCFSVEREDTPGRPLSNHSRGN